jgi:cytochrome b
LGLIGPEHARFVSVVRGQGTVFDYLAGLVRFSSRRYVGHSPAGGAMVVALLVSIAATSVTGTANLTITEGKRPLFTLVAKTNFPDRVFGRQPPPPLIRTVHETLVRPTLALVVLDVAGVVLASGRPSRKPGLYHDHRPDVQISTLAWRCQDHPAFRRSKRSERRCRETSHLDGTAASHPSLYTRD